MRSAATFMVLAAAMGCAPGPVSPGMTPVRGPTRLDSIFDELARVSPGAGERALVVVHPLTACSGTARTVFVDDDGTFYGSIGPGEGALLRVPAKARKLLAFSSVEVTASVGVWSAVDEIDIPPVPSGLLVSPWAASTRQCGSGHYASVSVATKNELETALGESPLRWLEPRPAEGQLWLDGHRARVDEILGKQSVKAPPVLTRVRIR